MTSEFVYREVAEILGVRAIVSGAPEEALSPRYWRLRSGLLVRAHDTTPILQSELRALDARQFICLISAISSVRFTKPGELRESLERSGLHRAGTFRDYQMAYALKVLLTDPLREPWSGLLPSPKDVFNACNMVAHVLCPADQQREPGWGWQFLQRMAYQQFWDQEDYSSWWRGLLLARELAPALATRGFSLADAIRSVLGLPLDDFLFLGFAFFAETVAQPGRVFGVQQFAGSRDFDIPSEAAETFLNVVSRDFTEYRAAAVDPSVTVTDYEPYNLNPLVRWPLIRLPDGNFVLPIPRLLLQRLTSGLYYDLISALTGPEAGAFGNLWGNVFQTYVGRLMQGLAGFPLVLPETKYQRNGHEVTSCDWLVRDRDLAIAIECKTRGLSAKSRITGSSDAIRQDLSRPDAMGKGSTLAGGVAKLFQTRQDILGRCPGLELLHGVSDVICVLVTLDQIYLANNGAHFQGILTEEALKFGEAGPPCPYQVTDIAGFEHLCRIVHATDGSAALLLKEKLSTDHSRRKDFQLHFPNLLSGESLPQHPLHTSVGEKALDELTERFRKRTG